MKNFVLNFLILVTTLTMGCSSDKSNVTESKNVLPVEGEILFKEQVFPEFVDKIDGVDIAEPFGRWTNAKSVKIYLNRPLPKDVKIKITCAGFSENKTLPSKIIIGNQEVSFTPTQDWATLDINIKLETEEKVISIIPAKPTRPIDVNGSPDTRFIGLALVSIAFEKNL